MVNKELLKRRKQFTSMLGKNSIAILPTAPVYTRNRDVTFPFRPDSDFYYLTGYPEPLSVAVLMPGRANGEYILFCRDNDPEMESWHGLRAGLQGACDEYGADEAFSIEDIDSVLPGLLKKSRRIFYNIGRYLSFDKRVLGWTQQIKNHKKSDTNCPAKFISLDPILHDMRLYKSKAELQLMRKAAKIAARAHKRVMRYCQPGMYEYQLEAELVHEFMRNDARFAAYPSIVGAGANGCILHYTDNQAIIRAGDLVLIDAGAEYRGYASDITRTFPATGKFSTQQRQVYDLVLAAQLAAIAKVRPGNHWNDPHDAAVKVLTAGMVALGILKGNPETLIKEKRYTQYFMHRTGHWLGMDVHDVGDYKIDGEWRVLEPGMVMTIEPGLYLPAKTPGLPRKWWNIAVRIEDDVLVTKSGCDVLSKDVPKAATEIEELMLNAT